MAFIYAPRLASFDYTGCYRYFLTICTCGRRRVLIDQERVAVVVTQLLRVATDGHFAVVAYCVMPDHLHVLMEGQDDAADLREFVRLFKQCSAFEWKRRFGSALWQRGYFDHVLRDEEDTLGVARYIIENPVRAGLVRDPEMYPYLGSFTVSVRDLLYAVQIEPCKRT
jgi:putative transposase